MSSATLLVAGLVVVCGATEPSGDAASLPNNVKLDRTLMSWDASALADPAFAVPAVPPDQKSERTLGAYLAYRYGPQLLDNFLRREDSSGLGGDLMLSRSDDRGFTRVTESIPDQPQERNGKRGFIAPVHRPRLQAHGVRSSGKGGYPGPLRGPSHYGGRPLITGGGVRSGGHGPVFGSSGHGKYPPALKRPSHYGGEHTGGHERDHRTASGIHGGSGGHGKYSQAYSHQVRGHSAGHGHGHNKGYPAALKRPSHYGQPVFGHPRHPVPVPGHSDPKHPQPVRGHGTLRRPQSHSSATGGHSSGFGPPKSAISLPKQVSGPGGHHSGGPGPVHQPPTVHNGDGIHYHSSGEFHPGSVRGSGGSGPIRPKATRHQTFSGFHISPEPAPHGSIPIQHEPAPHISGGHTVHSSHLGAIREVSGPVILQPPKTTISSSLSPLQEVHGPSQSDRFNRRPKFNSELGPLREISSPVITTDLGPVNELSSPVIDPAIHINTGGLGPVGPVSSPAISVSQDGEAAGASTALLQSQTVADILDGPAYEYTEPAGAPVAADSQGAPLYGSAGTSAASRLPAPTRDNSILLDSDGWKPMDDGLGPSQSPGPATSFIAGREAPSHLSRAVSPADPVPVPDSLGFVGQSLSEPREIFSALTPVRDLPSSSFAGQTLTQRQPVNTANTLPISIEAALTDASASSGVYIPPSRDTAAPTSSADGDDDLLALFRGDQGAVRPAVGGSGSSEAVSEVINPPIHINTGLGSGSASDTSLLGPSQVGSSGTPPTVALALLSVADEEEDVADISTSGSVTSSVVAIRPKAYKELQKTGTGNRLGQARAIRRKPNQTASLGRVELSAKRRGKPTGSGTKVDVKDHGPRNPGVTRLTNEDPRLSSFQPSLNNAVSSALAKLSAHMKAKEQARHRGWNRPTSTQGKGTATGATIVSVSSTATTLTEVSPTTTRALPLHATSIKSTVSIGASSTIPALASSKTNANPTTRTKIFRDSTLTISPSRTLGIAASTSTQKLFTTAISPPSATFNRPQTKLTSSRQLQPTSSAASRPRPGPTASEPATSTGWRFAHHPISWSFSAAEGSEEGTLSVAHGSGRSKTAFRVPPASDDHSVPVPIITTASHSSAPATVTGPRLATPTPTSPLSQVDTVGTISRAPTERVKAGSQELSSIDDTDESAANWSVGSTSSFTPSINEPTGSVSTSITSITLQTTVTEQTPEASQTPIRISPDTLSFGKPNIIPDRITQPINDIREGVRRRIETNNGRPQFGKKEKTPAFEVDLKPEPAKPVKTFTNGAKQGPVKQVISTDLPVKLPDELSITEARESTPRKLLAEAITAGSEANSETVSTSPVVPQRGQRRRQNGRRHGQRRFRDRRRFFKTTTTAAPEISQQPEGTEETKSAAATRTEVAQEPATDKPIRIRRKKLIRRKQKSAGREETEKREDEGDAPQSSRTRHQPPSGGRRAFRRRHRVSWGRRQFRSGQEETGSKREQEPASDVADL